MTRSSNPRYLAWGLAAFACALVFCFLASSVGEAYTVIIATFGGACIPPVRHLYDRLVIPWRARRENAFERSSAIPLIERLYDEINRSRHGSGDYWFDVDAEMRFTLARERALEIHRHLRLRAIYLDSSKNSQSAPADGANWSEIGRIARETVQQLRSAGYWCSQGIMCVNTDLLAAEWKLQKSIHVNETNAANLPADKQSVVVRMSEFNHLRRKKSTPKASATIVNLSTRI